MSVTTVEMNETWTGVIRILTESFERALAAGCKVCMTVYLADPATGEAQLVTMGPGGAAAPGAARGQTASPSPGR